MRINIVSGDAMAQYGESLGFKNCVAFGEAMVDGITTQEKPFSQGFIKS